MAFTYITPQPAEKLEQALYWGDGSLSLCWLRFKRIKGYFLITKIFLVVLQKQLLWD